MLTSILLLANVLAAQPAPANDAVLPAQVHSLVAELDSPSKADREVAEAKLVDLGTPVLALLPATIDASKPEVRARVARVRRTLEMADAATTGEASRVTLHVKATPISYVADEFSRQTSNKIILPGDASSVVLVTVDFDKSPFWKALDALWKEAVIECRPSAGKGAVNWTVSARPASPRPVSYCGPFRFEATAVHGSDAILAKCDMLWEPRISPILFTHRMADVRAVDGAGRPLAVSSPSQVEEIPASPEMCGTRLDFSFPAAPGSVRTIGKLQDAITAVVQGKTETFRFKGLGETKNVQQRIAGATVTLQEVRQAGPYWEVHLLVRYDQTYGAFASHLCGWIFSNPASLEGPDGKPLAYERYETSRQTDNEVGVVYFFKPDRPIGEYAFVYKTAGLILSLPLKYEFEGIKLP